MVMEELRQQRHSPLMKNAKQTEIPCRNDFRIVPYPRDVG
jgi:hypothetical protein